MVWDDDADVAEDETNIADLGDQISGDGSLKLTRCFIGQQTSVFVKEIENTSFHLVGRREMFEGFVASGFKGGIGHKVFEVWGNETAVRVDSFGWGLTINGLHVPKQEPFESELQSQGPAELQSRQHAQVVEDEPQKRNMSHFLRTLLEESLNQSAEVPVVSCSRLH